MYHKNIQADIFFFGQVSVFDIDITICCANICVLKLLLFVCVFGSFVT